MGKLKQQLITEQEMEDIDHNVTLYTIASIKAYNYCEEYNPYTGQAEPKHGAHLLKQGYMDGFIDGFAHKLTGE